MSICSTGLSREERQVPKNLKPLTVTIKTALQLLGIGRTTLYDLIDQGVVETITVGRRRLAIYSSLEALAGTGSKAPSAGCRFKTNAAQPIDTKATTKNKNVKRSARQTDD
jgi:excisionase family DNA binding protein